MTHFSSADEENREYTCRQFDIFMEFCSRLEKKCIEIPIKHVSNSSAVLRYPEMNLDMVRPGLAIYGLYSSPELSNRGTSLKPAMALKARVIDVNTVEKNEYLSYGRSFRANRKSFIATVSAGYADGYSRLLSNKGNVCMDHFMVDITDMEGNVSIGDEVLMFGRKKDLEISADEIADILGTISYEVIGRLGMRVPKV